MTKQWKSINGWLSSKEGEALQALAVDAMVLEIGSLFGRSTTLQAGVAKAVIAVDPHNGAALRNMHKGEQTFATFERNLDAAGIRHKVVPIIARWEEVNHLFAPKSFGLVFIDGDHSYEAAKRDIVSTARLLANGGALAVHDYGYASGHLAGVSKAVNEFVAQSDWSLEVVESLAILRRKLNA